MTPQPLLEISAGSKSYAGVRAIQDIDFTLYPGEVHALLGENGAGKSTLCKVIAGAVRLDGGRLDIEGRKREYTHPSQALRDGVAMVYQETSLVPTMTVAQNLRLGDEALLSRFRSLNIEGRQLMRSMNFPVQVTSLVSSLGSAQKQMVEIARAIRRRAKIVIFDEPTATLTPEETEQLFGAIGQLTRSGAGVIFVSHAIEQSLQIADRVTILRDGRHQLTTAAADIGRDEIIRLMVGRSVEYARRPPEEGTVRGPKVLSVENLTMGTTVKNMSFSAYAGEIVGIAGLVGSGRTEACMVVTGALKRNRVNGGRVLLDGRPVRYRVPRQAIQDGIVYITEDRKVNGFFETMSIAENIAIGEAASAKRLALLRGTRRVKEVAAKFIKRFQIRAINPNARVIELSGGNQQKVVLAKSLTGDPRVVIFDEPTRGVDVGSIEEIHQLIRQIADQGVAVVLISSYLPEIFSLSDRILVARGGRIVAEFSPDTATEESVMFAAVH
ncbi:sugar ABC transporter ATP-binding protein [Streptosporangium sp. NBC_01755]|uniref:sugar ABC transporter ATP-binding protein n=1 Tax=unclassified Streptosporangium TaxID=2632669 RepID=UPI002DD8020D|nr:MULTISPECIES: sugar ABC transporter ATP-binding protein [unclassified Streptosporangium]WSA28290.1 sugar ABC transporter ATP-binding protein [Streptosporangium sp. NBC_01810]WSD00233.1 sugar ABC transporter ATP-binding protein [Streptosporangium sp. NBC_01755]